MTVVVGVTRSCAAGDWETATPLPSTRICSPQERNSRLAAATDMPVTSGTADAVVLARFRFAFDV